MKKGLALGAAVCALVFIGCGGSNDEADGGGDLAHVVDLNGFDSLPPRVGCFAFVSCYSDCFQADPNATPQGCIASCGKTAKASAPGAFENALGCEQQHCLGDVDAMNGKCALIGGTLGGPNCAQCLGDATAALFSTSCMSMSSPDCNPSECKTLVDTCINDKP
jgi:hypothetical protein